jgi:cysteine desulfurase
VSGYLDAAAGVPLHPAAREALLAALDDGWADPTKLYAEGRRARRLLDGAREAVAAVVGARTDEVSFAPSGTLAAQLGLLGLLGARRRVGPSVVHSAVEHSCVLAAVAHAGWDRPRRCRSTGSAASTCRGTPRRSRPQTGLAALISASHEVGTVQPVEQVAELCAAVDVPLLVDAAQTVGRAPVPDGWSVLTASARKWGGPPGVGLLVVRTGTRWRSPLPAEDPAAGREPGGVPLPSVLAAAVGLQASAAEAAAEDARLRPLVDRLRRRIPELVDDVEVVGDPVDRLPHLVSLLLALPGRRDAAAVLDREGFSVSSGSSCSASVWSRATSARDGPALARQRARLAAPGHPGGGRRALPRGASRGRRRAARRPGSRLAPGASHRDGQQVRGDLSGGGLAVHVEKRPTKPSAVKEYSWVPTVSTTWVRRSAPTCAERSGDSPQPVAHRKPARKASPTRSARRPREPAPGRPRAPARRDGGR